MYWTREVEMPKMHINIRPREEKVQFRLQKEKRVIYPIGTNVFSKLEGRITERVLKTSADREFCYEDSSGIPSVILSFVPMFSYKTTMRLKSSVPFAIRSMWC